MAGPFLGINMTSQTLRSMQRALDTTGHNIANVNTAGYSRQRVDFSALTPLEFYSQGWHAVGQGVGIDGINRIRDQYLDQSARTTSSTLGKYSTMSTGLSRIDQIYGEPGDTGIANSLDAFFNAWSALASSPADGGAKAQVRVTGQTLADRVRSAYSSMATEKARVSNEINATLSKIDAITQEIASLNQQIKKFSMSNNSANDLMDRRDMAIENLSQLVNVTVEQFPDGSLAVYAAGATVVDSAGSRPFGKVWDAATSTVTDGTLTYNVRGGSLAGLLGTVGSIDNNMGSLDQLANQLRTAVNNIHATGTNSLGNTGVNFFNGTNTPPQTGAIDFDLGAEVKASAEAVSSGTSGLPSDGFLALTMSKLRDVSHASLGNRNFNDFYQDQVSAVATEASYYEMAAATENSVLGQVKQQQTAVSGVSLDDEMANMMRFQRSYQAAARALTVFDQVAEDLIGMLRR